MKMTFREARSIIREAGLKLESITESYIYPFNTDVYLLCVDQNLMLSTAKKQIVDKVEVPVKGLKDYEAYKLVQQYIKELIKNNYDQIMQDLHMFYIKTSSSTNNMSTYLNDDGSWTKCMRETEDLGEQKRSSITESTEGNAFTVDEICSIIADDLDAINAVDRCYPVEHFKVYLRGKKVSFDTGKKISFAVSKVTITEILNDISGLSAKEAKDYLKNIAQKIYDHNSYTKEMLRKWDRPSYLDNRY